MLPLSLLALVALAPPLTPSLIAPPQGLPAPVVMLPHISPPFVLVPANPKVEAPRALKSPKYRVIRTQRGEASVWTGRQSTAWGATYTETGMLAAHLYAPRGQGFRVTCKATGLSCVVICADRGPYGDPGRILDLSPPAAEAISLPGHGKQRLGQVLLEWIVRDN